MVLILINVIQHSQDFFTILSSFTSFTILFQYFYGKIFFSAVSQPQFLTIFLQQNYGSKSWVFQKSRFYTLWCPYWNLDHLYLLQRKMLLDNKNKDPETFVLSTKKINKNLCLSRRYILSGRKLKLPFSKWKQKGYKSLSCRSVNKKISGDVLLKKLPLKVSQNSNTCNRVSF